MMTDAPKAVYDEIHQRLGEGEAWRAKADVTFAKLGATLEAVSTNVDSLHKSFEDDKKSRSGSIKQVMLVVSAAVGSAAALFSFIVNAYINSAIYPISQRMAAVDAEIAAQSQLIGRNQDALSNGRDERVKQYRETDERLDHIEDYLDMMRKGELVSPFRSNHTEYGP